MSIILPVTKKLASGLSYRIGGFGPVLMLIHGFPADGDLWREIVQKLKHEFTVIVPDLPGTGGSSRMICSGISEMADELFAIFEEEDVDSAVIAGHSMGGYVALAFAEKFAAYVAGLSLVHSTAYPDSEERKQMRLKVVKLIENGGRVPFVREMVPNLFSAGFKQLHPEIVEKQTTEALAISGAALINFYLAMAARKDYNALLSAAKFPVHWVIGGADNVLTTESLFTQSAMCGTSFITFIKNGGHMAMLEYPEMLTSAFINFAQYCFRNIIIPTS
jgi:pimeloyl-ACP methyl ester carboxylesterase